MNPKAKVIVMFYKMLTMRFRYIVFIYATVYSVYWAASAQWPGSIAVPLEGAIAIRHILIGAIGAKNLTAYLAKQS